jgi:uncharacterized Zn finger protein
MARKEFGRSWWSRRFLEAIETFTDANRLQRGRTYARGSRVKTFAIKDGSAIATIRGSVNPYFGVYKEPTYITTIEFDQISEAKWNAAIALMGTNAGLLSKLMLREIPENIEEPFQAVGVHLLPSTRKDLIGNCSCPDYSNPCKHIAAVYYLVGAELDRDPYLLFELRGMPREKFHTLLEATSLGKAAAQSLSSKAITPQPQESYYPRPTLSPLPTTDLRSFWLGSKRLPKDMEVPTASPVSGILVKKQGDLPPFWETEVSFLEVMDELYNRVKTKNNGVL